MQNQIWKSTDTTSRSRLFITFMVTPSKTTSEFGETVIGEGSTIGGNVFLTTSVPPNSLVVFEGVTMKVMNKREREVVSVDFQI